MPPRAREIGSDEAPRGEPGAGAFVALSWLLAFVGSLALVGRFGANLPSWDDIGLLPVICGERPISLEWLWSPHNEHRLPLNRLALATLMRLSGNDFRSGMYASVAVMGLATFVLLIALRRTRGGWRYADSTLPMLLVGPSQHAVWLWCWELQFGLSAGLSLVLLAVLMRPRAVAGWDFEAAFIGALALILLPLCGVNGAVAAPALAIGLVVVTWQRGRKRPDLPLIVAGLGALIAIVLAAMVAQAGLESSRGSPRPDLSALLRTAGQFLAIGFGRPIAPAWPIASAFVVLMLAVAAPPMLGSLRDRRDGRASAAGLLTFLAASLTLALATAWGRASAGDLAGLEARYVTLSAPMFAGIYVALDRRADRAWPRFLIGILFVSAWGLSWPNASEAIEHGRDNRLGADAVERDLRARTPVYVMVRRHVPFLGPSQSQVSDALASLRDGNVGPFRRLGDNPPFDDVPVDPQSALLRQAAWDGETLILTGVDPAASYRVDPPRYLAGIQIRYDHDSRQPGPAHFRLEWRRPDQHAFPAEQVISEWNLPSGASRLATVWIADDVAEFRIRPDNRPGRFTIQSLRLLVPLPSADHDADRALRDRSNNQ